MPLTKSSDKKSNADLNKNASNDAPKAEARSPRRLPATPKPAVATELGALLDGPHAAFRDELRTFLNDPELFPKSHLPMAEQLSLIHI